MDSVQADDLPRPGISYGGAPVPGPQHLQRLGWTTGRPLRHAVRSPLARGSYTTSGTIGERVRLLRERAGLEQRTLAHRAAMSERKLRYIERGERNPLAPDIVALYEVLIERLPDLSLRWLLTGSPEPAGG